MLDAILKNRSWWEAPLIDLWSVPHLLSGTLICYALLQFGIGGWSGFLISLGIAGAWEVFEKVTHLSDVEHHTNGISDIVAAQLGYVAGLWLFSAGTDNTTSTIAIAAVAVIFTCMCTLGWLSHHWYGKK